MGGSVTQKRKTPRFWATSFRHPEKNQSPLFARPDLRATQHGWEGKGSSAKGSGVAFWISAGALSIRISRTIMLCASRDCCVCVCSAPIGKHSRFTKVLAFCQRLRCLSTVVQLLASLTRADVRHNKLGDEGAALLREQRVRVGENIGALALWCESTLKAPQSENRPDP